MIRYWSQNTTSDFQMGKGRTTTGMILACLIKDILFGESDKTYFKESDMVNPNDYSDEDEVAEEVHGHGPGRHHRVEELVQSRSLDEAAGGP